MNGCTGLPKAGGGKGVDQKTEKLRLSNEKWEWGFK